MIVNMSCPKCSGTASEYDVNKWSCLKCGNKFLYAPPPPPQTLIQSNVNIQGAPLFDLAPESACRPTPFFEKKAKRIPNYFDEITINDNSIRGFRLSLVGCRIKIAVFAAVSVLLLCLVVLFVIAGFNSAFIPGSKDAEGVVVSVIFGGVISFLLFHSFRRFRWARDYHSEFSTEMIRLRNRNQKVVAEKDDDVLVGHHVSCPYCSKSFEFIWAEHPMPVGLQHCLKCGKQFFTTNGYSYPLVHKGTV